MKRKIDLVVLSDIHLGTFGCHAQELLNYLKSIAPEKIILNGDIIDIWQFRKNYFPKTHLEIIRTLIEFSMSGTEIVYITGNHDEMLRKLSDFEIGNIKLVDKLILNLDGKKAWFFHGDVFDISVQNAKWIAKLGGWGYDMLILANRFLNFILMKLGREKYSLSKKIKNSVKKAVKFIDDFEKTATDLAIENGYHYVICGHIHQPQISRKVNKNGTCLYLNSGDWVENLTALEYHNKRWDLFQYSHFEKELEDNSPINLVDFVNEFKDFAGKKIKNG
ncbi:UDP-2,3-diacylglucosamine diphosphatase [Psychroflexus sp. CAK57W]|uniref:UDP-2,3-diacylglucosamine diphosphatase n=1 Tax=Psychroflexus curvus TaxID=2873595 RepID=UPI001CCF89C7|nr:UDP-2,3-diacylglucosamine diphosphatase [Psychroflexus curvus]MBZ9787892.1 UDP-2,3-diacylglucosamine diphosphatase [Psychroflexus curvus]